jgi:hypothetical protein
MAAFPSPAATSALPLRAKSSDQQIPHTPRDGTSAEVLPGRYRRVHIFEANATLSPEQPVLGLAPAISLRWTRPLQCVPFVIGCSSAGVVRHLRKSAPAH